MSISGWQKKLGTFELILGGGAFCVAANFFRLAIRAGERSSSLYGSYSLLALFVAFFGAFAFAAGYTLRRGRNWGQMFMVAPPLMLAIIIVAMR